MSKYFAYDHDFQSVPKVIELDDRTPPIRQYGQHVIVSAELLEDADGFATALFRPPTWAQQAEWWRHHNSIGQRWYRAQMAFRLRLSDAIFPASERDE